MQSAVMAVAVLFIHTQIPFATPATHCTPLIAAPRPLTLADQLSQVQCSLAQQQAAYAALLQQRQAKIDAVMAEYAPQLQSVQDQLAALKDKLAQLTAELEQWQQRIAREGLAGMHTTDVLLLLVQAGIVFDSGKVEADQVDGQLLGLLTTEAEAHDILGVQCVGDCTRVLQIVKHIAEGRGVPKTRDISVAGTEASPNTWSIEQFAQWAASTPSIAELAPALKQHRFAGDVILTAAVSDSVFATLKLTGKQSIFFKKEMSALRVRALAADAATDAVLAHDSTGAMHAWPDV